MTRLAIIGTGAFGANTLTALTPSSRNYLLGFGKQPLSGANLAILPAARLPRFAARNDCVIVVGDPAENEFGQLLAALASYLADKVRFLAAFIPDKISGPEASQIIADLASSANCVFQSNSESGISASRDLAQISNTIQRALVSNFVCVELEDLAALFRHNLKGFAYAGQAMGDSANLIAAHTLSEQFHASVLKRSVASFLHLDIPENIPVSVISQCCDYLRQHCQLGKWLFSASRLRLPEFSISLLATSPFKMAQAWNPEPSACQQKTE